jgi:hypothetical protein
MSQLLDAWNQAGYSTKLAVLLLILSAVPPVIWLLSHSRQVGAVPDHAHAIRVPAWVLMEAAAFSIALLLFWVGWLHRLDGLDCGGPCPEAESELSSVYATLFARFWVLLIIPVLSMVTWALVSRRRRRQS